MSSPAYEENVERSDLPRIQASRDPRPAAVAREYAVALAASLAVFVVVAVVLLHPYVTHRFRYPLGWDAAFYVWRSNAVGLDGLARIGAIRAALPLLTGILMRITRQNAFTIVAVIPPVLAAVAAAGAAAIARAAFRVPAAWAAVIGFLTWAAFGPNEIPLHHLDNLLNAALVLSAFAAALAFVETRRGVVAAALLFAAAGIAHWPFYLFAMAVYGFGVFLFASPILRRAPTDDPFRRDALPLLGAGVASGAFVGATLLFPPPTGWIGARPGALREVLHERILARFDDPERFVAVPFAVAGGFVVTAAERREPARARRLFLSLVAVWTALTILAIVAELLGVPVAGARILSYFFPLSLLAGVFVWWLAGRIRSDRTSGARVAAAMAIVAVAVAAFGSIMWASWSKRTPWFERDAVRQAAAASAYVARYANERPVVYVLSAASHYEPERVGRWWLVVKASLPAEQVPFARRYVGTPAGYLAHAPSKPLGAGLPPGESDRVEPDLWGSGARGAVAIMLERYTRGSFDHAARRAGERVVSPGVLVLRGPVPREPVAVGAPPSADTHPATLLWVCAVAFAVLLVSGAGWSMALVPNDAALRTFLAPALGAAAIVLVAFAWVVAGIPLRGISAAVPVLVAAVGGWLVAAARPRQGRRSWHVV